MKPDLLRHNLLLLVMAASSETKIGIQDIFIMMEKSSTTTINSENKNLAELVKHHCKISSEEFECIKMLNTYTCQNRDQWKKVSDDFAYARSFSFFRSRNSEEKDLVDVLTEYMFDNRADSTKVSDNSSNARSFSFFQVALPKTIKLRMNSRISL